MFFRKIKLQTKSFKTGFTLVEMLIVLTIIGIMAVTLVTNSRQGTDLQVLRADTQALANFFRQAQNNALTGVVAADGSPYTAFKIEAQINTNMVNLYGLNHLDETDLLERFALDPQVIFTNVSFYENNFAEEASLEVKSHTEILFKRPFGEIEFKADEETVEGLQKVVFELSHTSPRLESVKLKIDIDKTSGRISIYD